MNPLKAAPVEALDLEALNRALARTIFVGRIQYFTETGSTNILAMEAASRGTPEGTIFITDQQTRGKGRGGHNWHSEAHSNLLFSFIVRPKIAAADALWLSLMAGVAVCFAIREHTGQAADLRWPNDLLLNKKKFCGILTELASDGAETRHAVIGIGVNVNQRSFPDDLTKTATSLRIEGGKQVSRTELLIALLKSLHMEYNGLIGELSDKSASRRLLEKLKSVSSYVQGKRVQVSEAEGYEGTTAGLDERGFLLIRTANGIRRVISGGVRELE